MKKKQNREHQEQLDHINDTLKDFGLEACDEGSFYSLRFTWGEGLIFGTISGLEAYLYGLTQANYDP